MNQYLEQLTFALLLSFTIAACLVSQSVAEVPAPDQRPNILLIVVDDLGYADFEPTSNHDSAAVTLNIKSLALKGMVFEQAYTTAPVCSPSRAGLMTGKNQFRWDKPASWGPGLPDSVKTVAEYLQTAGYDTARIGKSDLGKRFHRHDVREYPLRHGYDHFLGFSAHAHDYWLNSSEIRDRTPDPVGTSALLGPLMHDEGERSYDEGYLTDIFSDEAIKFIEAERTAPYFLTLSYNSVHHLIHEVPKKYLDQQGVAPIENYDPEHKLEFGDHKAGTYRAYYEQYSRLGAISQADMRKYYLANLHCLDVNLGRVFKALEDSDHADNTIIVFVSDNGGSPLTGADNAPLTGGKYSLWEGGIRVPLAVVWPGKIKPSSRQQLGVSAADILPTLTNAAGIEVDDEHLDGVDLLAPEKDRLLVWKWQKTWAVRKGDWKLTNAHENHWKGEPSDQYLPPIVDDSTLKLFNVSDDPGERIDMASKHPAKVKTLELAYEQWCEQNIGKF